MDWKSDFHVFLWKSLCNGISQTTEFRKIYLVSVWGAAEAIQKWIKSFWRNFNTFQVLNPWFFDKKHKYFFNQSFYYEKMQLNYLWRVAEHESWLLIASSEQRNSTFNFYQKFYKFLLLHIKRVFVFFSSGKELKLSNFHARKWITAVLKSTEHFSQTEEAFIFLLSVPNFFHFTSSMKVRLCLYKIYVVTENINSL